MDKIKRNQWSITHYVEDLLLGNTNPKTNIHVRLNSYTHHKYIFFFNLFVNDAVTYKTSERNATKSWTFQNSLDSIWFYVYY